MKDLPFQDRPFLGRLQFDWLWRSAWRLLSSPRLAVGLFLALAFCAALGTLFPQEPPQANLSAWMEMIHQRYGSQASLYASLGLFHIYHTPLFITLVGALVSNTLACTLRRALSIWRATQRAPRVIQADAFYHRLTCHAAFAMSSLMRGLEAARSALNHHHYRITAARRGDVDYLYGERHRWARWATLVTHGAVILLMAALLLRGSLAWRELRVQLAPGQAYPVGHHTPWEVRLDRFSSRALGDGQSVEYQAHLTLLSQGQPVAEHGVRVNSPLSYGGLRVYLFSFGSREAFVVVDIVHDPSFLPVILSAALMVGGLSCTFAFPTHQLWVRVAPGEIWIAGRTSRDPLGFERHFRRLAQELEARLAEAGKEVGDG